MKLHTAVLLVLLTQGNKSTAANPLLQITACKSTRKASSVISFSWSSGLSPVLDLFFRHTRRPALRFKPWFPGFLYSLIFSFHGIWNPSLQARQNIVPNLHATCWSLEVQVSSDTHCWDYCISPGHTSEFVLFHPYPHPDLCLEKNLCQKGTGHVTLVILFGTTDSSLDYSKTNGRDIMSFPPTPNFSPPPKNTGAGSFSNTTCPQLTEEDLSLSFLQGRGILGAHGEVLAAEGGMLQLWPLRTGVSSTVCGGYLLQHHGVPPAPPPTLVFPLPFLIFSLLLLCLSSVFCPLSMFSWRCHKLGGWAQLRPAVGPLWSQLCLARNMPWSLLIQATPAANTLPWTGQYRGKGK